MREVRPGEGEGEAEDAAVEQTGEEGGGQGGGARLPQVGESGGGGGGRREQGVVLGVVERCEEWSRRIASGSRMMRRWDHGHRNPWVTGGTVTHWVPSVQG